VGAEKGAGVPGDWARGGAELQGEWKDVASWHVRNAAMPRRDGSRGSRRSSASLATTLGEVSTKAVVANAEEPLRAAVSRMAQTGRNWLPVVAHGDEREIVGEITLEATLTARVRHLEEEERRAIVLPLHAIIPVV
jgi:CBS-domain-containing membrane protein